MSHPHDPTGAAKLKSYTFTAWTRNRTHADDAELREGETRPPDTVLELAGLKLAVAFAGGRAVIVEENGIPVPLMEFIERARLEHRRIYGVIIATLED